MFRHKMQVQTILYDHQTIYICAVKRLITINRIQNKVFVYIINVCVPLIYIIYRSVMCTVFIYYVYINTRTHAHTIHTVYTGAGHIIRISSKS